MRNQAYVLPGIHTYNTRLSSDDERSFRRWVEKNKVPFDVSAPVSDYDMRGFWTALQQGKPIATTAIDPNDKRIHYPDYWKTPLHQTFSAESQWANPARAPAWNDRDQLVLPNGQVIYDDRAQQ